MPEKTVLRDAEKSANYAAMRYQHLLRDHLILLFDAFSDASGRSPTTISRSIASDSKFYSTIVDGKGFTVGKYDTIAADFAAIWPADVTWPPSVPRPDPEAASITNPTEEKEKWHKKPNPSPTVQN